MQGEVERLRDHCTFGEGKLRLHLLSSEVLIYLFINPHSTSLTASFQGIVEERTVTPSQFSQRLGEGLGSGVETGQTGNTNSHFQIPTASANS